MTARGVLITGGSRGIGAAMVRRFTADGDRVMFTYRQSRGAAEQLAAETGAIPYELDVSNSGAADAAVAAAIARLGSVQVLVNNAGVGLNRLLMDTTDLEYRQVMEVNVYGAFSMMRAVLPHMIERRGGAIINLSSIWGQTGGAGEALYSASKAAVIGLTRAAAKEVASAGIRVNCIAPGIIDTDMNRGLSPDALADLTEEIPLSRLGTPEDVASAAAFLASPAAAYITGQVISVNGGWRI